MSTLADPTVRSAMIDRVQQLTPDAKAQWGRMSAPQMLAHCTDALRMGLAELPVTPKSAKLPRLAIVKWLFLNVLPFPKNAPTARELVSRAPAPFDEERAHLIALMGKVGTPDALTRFAEHPLFGPLTREQWGQLAYKHLDHHLRQFGV
ncbi:MAG: DUF1569 domain-containing protein [Gemmatimonadaceae bacterium]|nr:DUF1569 domain-containing protein [Gemmatimonadaceae bacterium]